MSGDRSGRKIDRPPPPPEVQAKVEKSEREAASLTLRNVHCPVCRFVVSKVFSDAAGHIQIKCPKCKYEKPLNLAYFRRLKGVWKRKRKYYGEMYDEQMNIRL